MLSLQAFPNAAYAINLGLHIVHSDFPRPLYIMEVRARARMRSAGSASAALTSSHAVRTQLRINPSASWAASAEPGCCITLLPCGMHSRDRLWCVHAWMQVMPTLMAGRSFKPPHTQLQLELGYREAPSVHEPLAMVFIKVSRRHHACMHAALGRLPHAALGRLLPEVL